MNNLFHFADFSLPTQTNADIPFGPNPNNLSNKFRITSTFTITSIVKAFSVFEGTVLLQQQTGNPALVNLILKPTDLKLIKLPVKYVIYRGLDILSFLTATDLTLATTKVKTSGTELLVAMQLIQADRNVGIIPVPDIPINALFGHNLTPPSADSIDTFFNKNDLLSTSQLFPVAGGVELGMFAIGEVGIEIVLENTDSKITFDIAKRPLYEIDTTLITGPIEIKKEREKVRNFIDPAAFYGLHSDMLIEYRDASNAKIIADNPRKVFNTIVKKYLTKNKVYLDIRSEYGYSYNYYGNYIGTGVDADKELMIGQTASTLVLKKYYSSEWPVHIVDGIVPSSNAVNLFFIELRVTDNQRPLIAGWNSILSPNTIVDKPLDKESVNRIYYVDEKILLPIPIPSILPEFTNAISISVPNTKDDSSGSPEDAQIATIVKLSYIKQSVPISTSNIFPKSSLTDYLFGPLDITIPWDSENKIKWFSIKDPIYIDALSHGYVVGQYRTSILSIDAVNKEIEIFDLVPIDITKPIILENTSNTKLGTFEIESDGITYGSGKTKIKVKTTLPATLVIGDNATITIKVDGEFDYSKNEFVVKDKDHTNIEALSIGFKLEFYSKYNFINSYVISGTTLIGTNTHVAFSVAKPITGFACFADTGIISETDLTIGGSSDSDRMTFYASPFNYFMDKGITKSPSFGSSGGFFNYESTFKALEALMPTVKIDRLKLLISAGNQVNTFAYNSTSKVIEPLFLLGLTKTEWTDAKTAAVAVLDATVHKMMFKMANNGSKKNDTNKVEYFEYDLQVAGLNTAGTYQTVTTGVKIYTRDHLIFTSKNYGGTFDIDITIAEQALIDFINDTLDGNGSEFLELTHFSKEEESQIKKGRLWTVPSSSILKTNKELFNLEPVPSPATDPSFKNSIRNLKTALDTVTETELAITDLLRLKGAELIIHGRKKIRQTAQPFVNKDGMLYLARLIAQIVIKNHPKLLSKFPSKIKQFSDVYEKASRGLDPLATSYPDFTKYYDASFNLIAVPANAKKILISGYDPFGAGADGENYNSNPSGNIALSLDGTVIKDLSNTIVAVIRSVTFPVRYREFNDGWVEDFFKIFINKDLSNYINVNMIITFSYGGAEYFNLDRFASRLRNPSHKDNNKESAHTDSYLTNSEKDDFEFIESSLPYNDLYVANKVVLHQRAYFDYYQNSSKVGSTNNTSIDNFNINELLPFPSFVNYPPSSGITANKIKALYGSGGDYLSNEIFYRVSFLRNIYNPILKTGHIHVGFLNTDPSTDRQLMLDTIKSSLLQAIPSLTSPLDEFLNILNPNYDGSTDIFTGISTPNKEERNNLSGSHFWIAYGTGLSNQDLFFLDPSMVQKISQFFNALYQVTVNLPEVKKVLTSKGEDLLRHAKAHIKGKNPSTNQLISPIPAFINKDGILYLTRLIMQTILKNHPKITANFSSDITTLSDLFEKHSRGLEGTEKPNFASYPNFKILISGFDPFGSAFPNSYYDEQGHQSNPSGNLALALDGVELTSSNGKKAIIKSVILPTRFREFDLDWIETFFTPYVNDLGIKMIITFSYGIDGEQYSFEIEKYAARNRGLGVDSQDNNEVPAPPSDYLNDANKDNYEFIISKLPFNDMFILNNVGLDQKAIIDYYNNATFVQTSFINNYDITTATINRVVNPFSPSALPYNNDIKASYSPNVPFPDITNYPGSGIGITANKIKSNQGSGGDYLSNEVFYRVSFLREFNSNPLIKNKFTGHIHLGFLQGDPILSKTEMLTIIQDSIKQALSNF